MLFGAATREFMLLFDQGRDLPPDLARACQSVITDLMCRCETPDLVQTVTGPADDGRLFIMICPGWRLMDNLLRLRRYRTFR